MGEGLMPDKIESGEIPIVSESQSDVLKEKEKSELEIRAGELKEKTGFNEAMILSALDIFDSREAPFELSQDEVENFLIEISKDPEGKTKLINLYNASNGYNKAFANAVFDATGVEGYRLSDYEEEGGQTLLKNRGVYKTNNIVHLSDNFYRFVGRCRKEGVDYSGLEENANDQTLNEALQLAEIQGTWFRVESLKNTLVNISNDEVDSDAKDSYFVGCYRELVKAKNDIQEFRSTWGSQED